MSGWIEAATSPDFAAAWKAHMGDTPAPRGFSRVDGKDEWFALLGHEPVGPHGTDHRWHLSVRHERRVPTWDELAAACHELRPGVVFVLAVPPRSWWINVHEFVLHAWEVRDENLTEMWRAEGRGDEPTAGRAAA